MRPNQKERLRKNHSIADEAIMKQYMYNYSRVGLHNVRPEHSALANIYRVEKRPYAAMTIGDSYTCWRGNNRNIVAYEREKVTIKNNKIYQLYYEFDKIQFSVHSLERLFSRTGKPLDSIPNYNLGHNNLQQYLELLHPKMLSFDCEGPMVRSDIIVPYRGGAFLGKVVNSDLSLGIKLIKNQYQIFHKSQKNFSVFYSNNLGLLSFCCETYISKDMLRDDQKQVVEYMNNNMMDIASTKMLSLPSYQYELIPQNQEELMIKGALEVNKIIDNFYPI